MPTFQRFSTLAFPEEERAVSWKRYLGESLFEAEYRLLGSDTLRAEHAVTDLESHAVHKFALSRHTVDRTAADLPPLGDKMYFTIVVSGRASYWSNTHMEIANPGDVLVYDPDDPFQISFHDGTREILIETDRDLLSLDADTLESLPRKLDSSDLAAAGLGLDRLTHMYRSMTGRDDNAQLLRQSTEWALDLFGRTLEGAASHTYFANAHVIIRSRLNDPALDLASVAEELAISVRHLSRVFHERGRSVAQVIINERMKYAASLLRRTDASVSQVAIECGYQSSSHFSRTFARIIGQTPAEYRRAGARP